MTEESSKSTFYIEETALEILKTEPWDTLTFEILSKKTGMTQIQLYNLFPTRSDLLRSIVQMIDDRMLVLYSNGEGMTSSAEKLFDVIMCRFEALNSYKYAMKNILKSFWRDPFSFPTGILSGIRSIRLMLNNAGFLVEGIQGAFNIKIFTLLYLFVLKTWYEDEDLEMAKTMAQVDQGIKNIISFLKK